MLVRLLAQVSSLTKLPVAGMDRIAVSDEEMFIAAHVCTLTLHSLTPDNQRQFRTVKDNAGLVRMDDYARTYSLALVFLAELDVAELPAHACTVRALPLGRWVYLPGYPIRR